MDLVLLKAVTSCSPTMMQGLVRHVQHVAGLFVLNLTLNDFACAVGFVVLQNEYAFLNDSV